MDSNEEENIPLKIEKYIKGNNLENVLSCLEMYQGKGSVIAGGTDLIPAISKKLMTPSILIDLDGIPQFKVLREEDDKIILGAGLTHNEILDSSLSDRLPALKQSLSEIACNQTRNMGTIGGNIAMALPSADSATPLLVYDAVAEIASKSRGSRLVPLEEFFIGPRRTVLESDELVVRFILSTPINRKSAFIKHGRRMALSLAIVNVAVGMQLENGRCKNVRIALGAVAPTPVRAYGAEKLLEGITPNLKQINEAAELAARQECSPIDDHRASCDYRRDLINVYVKRALISVTGLSAETLAG